MSITLVGTGAGVTGNNTSVTPTAVAGIAVGDLAVIHATINLTTATVNTPAGWTRMNAVGGNEALFGRFWQATDTMPLVSFTGGAANADTTVQSAAFRGAAPDSLTPPQAKLVNVSAANVAYPALAVTGYGANRVVIIAAWKGDDSTSVAPPGGFTQLGFVAPTAGNDSTAWWAYQIQTTATDIASGSLVVTGGVAAVSQGITLALRAAAALTATAVTTVWPPRVLLTATGLDIGSTVYIYRVVAGQRTLVRGTGVPVTATTIVITDAEIPFGIGVTYVLTVVGDDATTTSVSYTLPGGKVAISDAITAAAAETVVLSWPNQDQDAVASVFVVDRKNIVVHSGLGQYRSTVDLYTETTAGGDALDAVLNNATSGIVQIRQPGGYDGVDGYWAVLGVGKVRWSQDGSDQRRIWTVDVAEVDAWASGFSARGFTYANVITKYTGLTYANWGTDYATYLLAMQGDYS